MMTTDELDRQMMGRAIALAARGQGAVEPNPMVGCVIAERGQVIAEGFHEHFGGPHAEVVALKRAGGRDLSAATVYVTLEPCCHHGKTPPCTAALIAARPSRVVVAHEDPFPEVGGRGIRQLREAAVHVDVGVLETPARQLNAPYIKLVTTGRPWVIAKWAMTIDGKIAARSGDSRWISGEVSRRRVHEIRGRVDAVIVGSGTARADDPLLTARPPGVRSATRIVVDSHATLPLDSRLVQTTADAPVLVAAGPAADPAKVAGLKAARCEVLTLESDDHHQRLGLLLDELGRRRMTSVLVEGGGRLLGALFDAGLIDEVRAFIAPQIVGGEQAPAPLGGLGKNTIAEADRLDQPIVELLDGDIYIHGRLK